MEEENKGTVVPELSGPIEIKLHYPVKLGSSENAELIESLTFRRPKGKDMRDIPAKPAVADLMKLASKLCGQPLTVIDLLEMPDFNRVTQVVSDFLNVGQETGGI